MPRVSKFWKISTSILAIAALGVFSPISAAQDAAVQDADAAAIVETSSAVSAPDYSLPDYSPMAKFMEVASANSRGRPSIAYKPLRKQDIEFFDSYEAYLAGIDVEPLSQDDQLAYWLNLQNFLAVKAVTQDTSKTNIKSLRGTRPKPGKLWTQDRVTLQGQTYSLVDIETKIITQFDDPNVLYGIYQGVKGGPCLSDKPYAGDTVNDRLAELAKHYVNSRGIVTPQKRKAYLTPIYDWYKAELFDDNDKTLLTHIKSNASTSLRGRLNTVREIDFTKLNYDIDNFVPEKQVRGNDAPRQRQAPQRQPVPSGGSGGGGYGS